MISTHTYKNCECRRNVGYLFVRNLWMFNALLHVCRRTFDITITNIYPRVCIFKQHCQFWTKVNVCLQVIGENKIWWKLVSFLQIQI